MICFPCTSERSRLCEALTATGRTRDGVRITSGQMRGVVAAAVCSERTTDPGSRRSGAREKREVIAPVKCAGDSRARMNQTPFAGIESDDGRATAADDHDVRRRL